MWHTTFSCYFPTTGQFPLKFNFSCSKKIDVINKVKRFFLDCGASSCIFTLWKATEYHSDWLLTYDDNRMVMTPYREVIDEK